MKRLTYTLSILMLGAAANLPAADFLPLAPGNQWTYQDAATGQSFTVQVGFTQFFINEHVYNNLRGYTPRPLWVRVNEYGNIVYWDQERETDVMLTSFEFVRGAFFEAAGRECPEMGQTQEHRVVHNGPAGNWSALENKYIVSACADVGDISEQYVENIGMVQRVVNTIAGPRTFNLVHATLGAQSITAGQSGSFTVSALQAPEPGFWSATLRINQTLPPTQKLHFTSSQEFDARLRDSKGNIVWTWSADKLFAQAEHDLQGGRWTAMIAVPQPSVPEGDIQYYTLEAWLTNAEGGPRFAAAATVAVPLVHLAAPLARN